MRCLSRLCQISQQHLPWEWCFSFPFPTILQSCDLWSLGVIIYVMLCGYPPFYSKHHSRTIPKDMRKKIMTGSFDFPEDEWSQISEMAKDIVRKWDFLCFPVAACWCSCWTLMVSTPPCPPPRCRQAPKGEARGEVNYWRSPGSSLAQLHWGSRQHSAFCSDDDGQGEGTIGAHGRRWPGHCLNTAVLALVSFQAVVAGIQQAHAEQLANMRIQDLNISLKPLNSVNNPILRKRKLLGYDGALHECVTVSHLAAFMQIYARYRTAKDRAGHVINSWVWKWWSGTADQHFGKQMLRLCSPKPNDGFFIHDPENGGEDSNIALEKLRDVIAQCILPQAGSSAQNASGKFPPRKAGLEAERMFLCLQERTRTRSWTSWCTKRGGSIETASCWETACRASAGTVSLLLALISEYLSSQLKAQKLL